MIERLNTSKRLRRAVIHQPLLITSPQRVTLLNGIAKTKTLTAQTKTHGTNENSHGTNENFTAQTKTLTAEVNLTAEMAVYFTRAVTQSLKIWRNQ